MYVCKVVVNHGLVLELFPARGAVSVSLKLAVKV